jgi:hypothetical protein
MNLAQVVTHIDALEREVLDLREKVEYERAVAGIRRGLDSANRGEGQPIKQALRMIRRNYKNGRP